MKLILSLLILTLTLNLVVSEVFFSENFEAGWENRWVKASKRSGLGEWAAEEGGLKTKQDAKFYAISAKLDKSFSNEKKPFVVQFTVKHPQGIDCGGGYVKLLPKSSDFSQEDFKGESPYNVMFGPDICGGNKKVHVIFNYKGKNLDWKKKPNAESDKLTHIYTLVVKPDSTFEYLLDGVSKEKGSLSDGWPFLLPKEIPDPNAKKPSDWVDNPKMLDVNDKKPEDWDNEPKTVADPKAQKPDGWDDEEDGEWTAPQVPNPKYKGEWKQRMINNPKYKGPWVAPNIPNPDFVNDENLGKYADFSYIGLDLWQVKSGTVFGNMLITDEVKAAEDARKSILEKMDAEKKANKEKEEKEAAEKKLKEDEIAKQTEERIKKEEAEKAKKEAEEKAKENSEAEKEKLTKLAKEQAEQLKKDMKEEKKEEKDEL